MHYSTVSNYPGQVARGISGRMLGLVWLIRAYTLDVPPERIAVGCESDLRKVTRYHTRGKPACGEDWF